MVEVARFYLPKESIGRESGGVALDLTEVTFVERDVVNFLAACELRGIELRNCPGYVRRNSRGSLHLMEFTEAIGFRPIDRIDKSQ